MYLQSEVLKWPSQLLSQLVRSPRRLGVLVLFILFVTIYRSIDELAGNTFVLSGSRTLAQTDLDNITETAEEYARSIIRPPYKDQFWELGQRSRELAQWIDHVDKEPKHSKSRPQLAAAIETAAAALFPFVKPPSQRSSSKTPLSDLRASFTKNSQGIVIPVGGGDQSVRFAGHLIASLRDVLGCELPIQIIYAGESDLSKRDRDILASLDASNSTDFLNVLEIFDDSTLRLAKGGWAIKPFGALASPFEQVILLDADAVFLQKPETLLKQSAFIETGAYLFHDRLLWQHAFRERHDWWKDQIKVPSPALNKSLVWTEDYAEECDSGVVVLDKSRPEVLVGLLHVAWQNTYDVREEVSYKLTYGDKETWWLGLELAGSGYRFEEHYGSMLGWEKEMQSNDDKAETRVCSFVIAHMNEKGNLSWYNGGLLKNKLVDLETYQVPDVWMMDGDWEKGGTKQDMSCMVRGKASNLTDAEKGILGRSIEAAKRVDSILREKGLMISKEA